MLERRQKRIFLDLILCDNFFYAPIQLRGNFLSDGRFCELRTPIWRFAFLRGQEKQWFFCHFEWLLYSVSTALASSGDFFSQSEEFDTLFI